MTVSLDCPFTVRENHRAGEVEGYLRDALASVGADAALRGFDLGRLTGLAYPFVSLARLRVAALWFAFFWLFDDAWADRLPLDRIDAVEPVHRRVAELAAGGANQRDDDAALRLLSVLLDEIRAIEPGWDIGPFRHELLRYVRATLWEIRLRKTGGVPSLSEYLRMRPHIGAVPASRELNFLLCELELAPWVKSHPIIELVDAAVGNYSCWVNDVYSLKTEGMLSTNLVVVAEHEFGWERRKSIDWAIQLANEEVRTFVELREALPGLVFPGLARTDPAVYSLERYLDHYEGWFVASARWMSTTAKYRPDQRV
ncbi:hypothetical protein [Nocardia sp. NPDC050175]|uniref:terpene synthase family protein n=1 Tax=Nocardia sp. NPDC050175 TaxID=3364317 RepID=UPI0037AD6557